jgi:hypothetical protein
MKRITKAALAESRLTKQEYEQMIESVSRMGSAAFTSGKQSAPCLNNAFMSFAYERELAHVVRVILMEAYSNAWMRLQRAAANELLKELVNA